MKTKDPQTILRKAIESEMARQGISRAELARRCLVPAQNITNALNGERGITLDRLLSIFHALHPDADLIRVIERAIQGFD